MMALVLHRVVVCIASLKVMTNAKLLTRSKPGCGALAQVQRTHANSSAAVSNPGAGLVPITPYEASYKDGFYYLDCITGSMLLYGDKFGSNKYDYKLGSVSNVSIIHYTEVVPKEDQQTMTHDVCFGFCRTVPEMLYFGVNNGRDCYCLPYYKAIAGDSSQCDMPCDGNPTEMCGGKTKSSVFGMHACNDATENLAAAKNVSENVRLPLVNVLMQVALVSETMQRAASDLQKAFGRVGDEAATTNLQLAKDFAGTLEHAAEEGNKVVEVMLTLEAANAEGSTAAALAASSEAIDSQLADAAAKGKSMINDLAALQKVATPPVTSSDTEKLYYPVMYFVDREFVETPSTCGGEAAAQPAVTSFEGCAQACEALPSTCVGYSYFSASKDGLCFLFSTMKSVTYYTGCGGVSSFLQRKGALATKCVVKFAKFDGTTLKPDASGKCDNCLKTASKADRCFE